MTKYDDNDTDKHSRPVTVIFKRIANKNKTKEFEEWLSRYKYEFELNAIYEKIRTFSIHKLVLMSILYEELYFLQILNLQYKWYSNNLCLLLNILRPERGDGLTKGVSNIDKTYSFIFFETLIKSNFILVLLKRESKIR